MNNVVGEARVLPPTTKARLVCKLPTFVAELPEEFTNFNPFYIVVEAPYFSTYGLYNEVILDDRALVLRCVPSPFLNFSF